MGWEGSVVNKVSCGDFVGYFNYIVYLCGIIPCIVSCSPVRASMICYQRTKQSSVQRDYFRHMFIIIIKTNKRN